MGQYGKIYIYNIIYIYREIWEQHATTWRTSRNQIASSNAYVHFCRPLRVSAKLYTGITAFPYRLTKIAKKNTEINGITLWYLSFILVFG